MSEMSFSAIRAHMVKSQLASRGVHDKRVLEAMKQVPREDFVPAEFVDRAYDDAPLAIGCDQTISQPLMVALMTQALQLKPEDRVLEIGTGSGYQAAVLSLLASHVYTIERHAPLARAAAARLKRLGYVNVTCIEGDGSLGWPDEAPYDAIIVTAAAPEIPKALLSQLGPGGRMVIPVGSRTEQICQVVQRTPRGTRVHELTACRFVPLLGAEGWEE